MHYVIRDIHNSNGIVNLAEQSYVYKIGYVRMGMNQI